MIIGVNKIISGNIIQLTLIELLDLLRLLKIHIFSFLYKR